MISWGEILSFDFGYSVALVESIAVFLLGSQFPLWIASIFHSELGGKKEKKRSEVVIFLLCRWLEIQPEKSFPAEVNDLCPDVCVMCPSKIHTGTNAI